MSFSDYCKYTTPEDLKISEFNNEDEKSREIVIVATFRDEIRQLICSLIQKVEEDRKYYYDELCQNGIIKIGNVCVKKRQERYWMTIRMQYFVVKCEIVSEKNLLKECSDPLDKKNAENMYPIYYDKIIDKKDEYKNLIEKELVFNGTDCMEMENDSDQVFEDIFIYILLSKIRDVIVKITFHDEFTIKFIDEMHD